MSNWRSLTGEISSVAQHRLSNGAANVNSCGKVHRASDCNGTKLRRICLRGPSSGTMRRSRINLLVQPFRITPLRRVQNRQLIQHCVLSMMRLSRYIMGELCRAVKASLSLRPELRGSKMSCKPNFHPSNVYLVYKRNPIFLEVSIFNVIIKKYSVQQIVILFVNRSISGFVKVNSRLELFCVCVIRRTVCSKFFVVKKYKLWFCWMLFVNFWLSFICKNLRLGFFRLRIIRRDANGVETFLVYYNSELVSCKF